MQVSNIFDGWNSQLAPHIRKYLGVPAKRKVNLYDEDLKKMLTAYLIFHDLPKGGLKDVTSDEASTLLALERGLGVEGTARIGEMVR